jgi:uncharacterized protein
VRAGLTGMALAAVLALLPGLALAAGPCAADRVDLRWDGGAESFAVELADEPDERALGLMFRRSMDPGAGMLFVYESPRRAQFWMKNTFIPLDMIFADASGRVTRVHSNAIPQDETPIDGGDGVVFVLEINGGLAQRLGLEPGAELRHPAIDPALASWPCEG